MITLKLRSAFNSSRRLVVGALLVCLSLASITYSANGVTSPRWQTYTNSFDRYAIDIPEGWFVIEPTVQGAAITISNFDKTLETQPDAADPDKFSLDIVVFENPHNLAVDQFLMWHDSNNYEGVGVETQVDEQTQVVINGKEGVRRRISTVYGSAWEVILENLGQIYLIATRAKPNFESEFNGVVQSFRFTN